MNARGATWDLCLNKPYIGAPWRCPSDLPDIRINIAQRSCVVPYALHLGDASSTVPN